MYVHRRRGSRCLVHYLCVSREISFWGGGGISLLLFSHVEAHRRRVVVDGEGSYVCLAYVLRGLHGVRVVVPVCSLLDGSRLNYVPYSLTFSQASSIFTPLVLARETACVVAFAFFFSADGGDAMYCCIPAVVPCVGQPLAVSVHAVHSFVRFQPVASFSLPPGTSCGRWRGCWNGWRCRCSRPSSSSRGALSCATREAGAWKT